MLQAFCKDAKSKDLGFRHCVIARWTIREHGGKLRCFGKPAAVVFELTLNVEIHDGLR